MSFSIQCPEFNKKLPGISGYRKKRKTSDTDIELGGTDFKKTRSIYSRKQVARGRILTEN